MTAIRHRKALARAASGADSDVVDWTIEVADGADASAGGWRRAHGENLIEAALTHGAQQWTWVVRDWGVLLEVAFDDEVDWLRFRATPAVRAALDAVPDPVNGLYVYAGRGGGSGAGHPRRPGPAPRSGAAALPEPVETQLLELAATGLRPGIAGQPNQPRPQRPRTAA